MLIRPACLHQRRCRRREPTRTRTQPPRDRSGRVATEHSRLATELSPPRDRSGRRPCGSECAQSARRTTDGSECAQSARATVAGGLWLDGGRATVAGGRWLDGGRATVAGGRWPGQPLSQGVGRFECAGFPRRSTEPRDHAFTFSLPDARGPHAVRLGDDRPPRCRSNRRAGPIGRAGIGSSRPRSSRCVPIRDTPRVVRAEVSCGVPRRTSSGSFGSDRRSVARPAKSQHRRDSRHLPAHRETHTGHGPSHRSVQRCRSRPTTRRHHHPSSSAPGMRPRGTSVRRRPRVGRRATPRSPTREHADVARVGPSFPCVRSARLDSPRLARVIESRPSWLRPSDSDLEVRLRRALRGVGLISSVSFLSNSTMVP